MLPTLRSLSHARERVFLTSVFSRRNKRLLEVYKVVGLCYLATHRLVSLRRDSNLVPRSLSVDLGNEVKDASPTS